MGSVYRSYDEVVRARRGSAEFRDGFDEARRAYLIGRAVRERRVALGLTQSALATKAGMTQSALSQLEGGSSVPTIPVLDRLASAMGTELTVAFEPAAT